MLKSHLCSGGCYINPPPKHPQTEGGGRVPALPRGEAATPSWAPCARRGLLGPCPRCHPISRGGFWGEGSRRRPGHGTGAALGELCGAARSPLGLGAWHCLWGHPGGPGISEVPRTLWSPPSTPAPLLAATPIPIYPPRAAPRSLPAPHFPLPPRQRRAGCCAFIAGLGAQGTGEPWGPPPPPRAGGEHPGGDISAWRNPPLRDRAVRRGRGWSEGVPEPLRTPAPAPPAPAHPGSCCTRSCG